MTAPESFAFTLAKKMLVMISRELQIQAKIDRLNRGVDLCIFDSYTFRAYYNNGWEEITLYKMAGVWIHPVCMN